MSTKIEWTDETWNPVTGCTKVSQGCKHCYAERLAPKVFAGQMVEPTEFHEAGPEPRKRVFTDVWCHPERLDAPLHWKRPRRVFVNSMSDLFHEDVPLKFIAAVFGVMASCPQHTFQILTKRPARMRMFFKWLGAAWGDNGRSFIECDPLTGCQMQAENHGVTLPPVSISTDKPGPTWPLKNVWLGVSVEDQATADERIGELLGTPAAVRFLSCEPLLGPINLISLTIGEHWLNALTGHYSDDPDDWNSDNHIDWVIAGGESGPGARPAHPDWFRSLRDQCAAAGVAFFFKQWGEWAPGQLEGLGDMRRVGKKAAGRLLDGRTHDEYPEAS